MYQRHLYKRVILNFLFFFLVIYSYYIAKPIRNSLFLEWMGPQELPFVYLLSSVITLIGAFTLDKMFNYFPPIKLIPSTIGLFVFIIAVFWYLLTTMSHIGHILSFILYLFISLYAVTGVSLFWATCNDTHTPEEGKKYYSYIGLGGILGGLAGGETTKLLAGTIGTENLLLVSAGILALTLPLPYLIISEWHRINKTMPKPLVPENIEEPEKNNDGLLSLFKRNYIIIIAGLIFIFTLMSSLLDFQYQTIIKNANLPKDLRTAYFGRIFTLINIAGIFIHLLLTRPVLKFLGPVGGLLPLPIIALIGSLYIWLFPTIDSVAILWAVYGGVAYSLNQVTRETLYIPVPRHLKYRAKFYNDTFVYRFGDAFAAFIILLSHHLLNVDKLFYLFYDIVFCVIWISIIFYFYFRFLQKRVVDI